MQHILFGYFNIGLNLVQCAKKNSMHLFIVLTGMSDMILFVTDSLMIASNVKKKKSSTALVCHAYFLRFFFLLPKFYSFSGRKFGFYCLQCLEETKERIKNMFNKVELSISSYDTAWVAMVPSQISHAPLFPQCLNWLLDNQHCDGSWGLPDPHPLLINDALLSTLACILALKQWGIGEDQINKGTYAPLIALSLPLLLYK